MPDGTAETREPTLARPQALAERSGRPAADATLLARLEDASRRFRSAVHWYVNRRVDEAEVVVGSGSRTLLLPAQNVTAVSGVTVDGVAVPAGAWRLQRGLSALRLSSGAWPAGADVEFVYSYGYADDTIPSDISSAVLQLAETLLNVTAGLASRTVLGDTMQFGTAATIGATQDWVDAVANHVVGRGDRA
jgi:hypothetical protein